MIMDSYKQMNKPLLGERGGIYYSEKAIGYWIFIPAILLFWCDFFLVNEIIYGRNVALCLGLLFILGFCTIITFAFAVSWAFARQRISVYNDGFLPKRKPFFYALRHPKKPYFVKWSDVTKIGYNEVPSKVRYPSRFKNLKKCWLFTIWERYRGKERMHLIDFDTFKNPNEAYRILRKVLASHPNLPWVNVNDMFRLWAEEKRGG